MSVDKPALYERTGTQTVAFARIHFLALRAKCFLRQSQAEKWVLRSWFYSSKIALLKRFNKHFPKMPGTLANMPRPFSSFVCAAIRASGVECEEI